MGEWNTFELLIRLAIPFYMVRNPMHLTTRNNPIQQHLSDTYAGRSAFNWKPPVGLIKRFKKLSRACRRRDFEIWVHLCKVT